VLTHIFPWVMAYVLLQGTIRHNTANATKTIETINQHAVISSGQVWVARHYAVLLLSCVMLACAVGKIDDGHCEVLPVALVGGK